MAAVTGTIVSVSGFTVPRSDPTTITNTSEYQVFGCYVDVTFPSGTYASADNATFAPATAIAAARRNGRTPTIKQACFAGVGDENGAIVGADACTVSTGTVTCQLLQENLTTEHADGAMSATWNKPIRFYVTCVERVY